MRVATRKVYQSLLTAFSQLMESKQTWSSAERELARDLSAALEAFEGYYWLGPDPVRNKLLGLIPQGGAEE